MNKFDYIIAVKRINIPNPVKFNLHSTISKPDVFCAVLVNVVGEGLKSVVRRIYDLEDYLKTGGSINEELIEVDEFVDSDRFNLY